MALLKEGYLHYKDIKKFFKILLLWNRQKEKLAMFLSKIQVNNPGPFWPFLAHLSTKCSWWAFVIAQCPSSVVHNFFKHLLLLNHWANLDETWQGCSLGEALPKLFKRLNSSHNSGCHGNQKEKNRKIFENLLLWN